MKRLIYLVLILLVFGCSDRENQEERQEKRGKILIKWLEAAEYVAEKTQDKQALEIIEFVRAHAHPADVYEEGIGVSEEALNDPYGFGILPVISGDEKINEYVKEIVENENIGAAFNPEGRIISIRGEARISKLFKGILMLHECAHAYAFLTEPYDWTDVRIFSKKERDVHEFQNRITRILGGPDYIKLIDKEVDNIEVPEGIDLNNEIIIVENYGVNADKFFGPSLSMFEENFRGTSIAIEINFKLFERKFKGDIEEKKAISLFKRYDESGILPLQE